MTSAERPFAFVKKHDGCGMCREMACCPDHCCDWDNCNCGDCEQCGGQDENPTVETTTRAARRLGADSDDDQPPSTRSFLSSRSFWDDYYADRKRDAPMEFCVQPPTLLELVAAHAPCTSASVLELGVGNSTLAHTLRAPGYTCVLGVDFS